MEFLVVSTVFFFLVCVVGPIFGPDDRPGFRDPERRVRQPVGSWFHTSR